jgi:DNA (cytosine-5)-methyltransferase 1
MLALAVREQVFGDEIPVSLDYLRPNEVLGFRRRKRALTAHYKKLAEAAISERPLSVASRDAHTGCVTRSRALTPDFGWREIDPRDPDAIQVRVDQSNGHLDVTLGPGPHAVTVDVVPSSRGWSLGIESARLEVGADPLALTAAWKAFEEEVRVRFDLADLVQASGYYVYDQQIRASVVKGPKSMRWRLLRAVCEGRGVGGTASLDVLRDAWGLDVDDVRLQGLLRELRSWGYEVRSSRTNPQIPPGEYLVPYAFPTFTPRSVQRNKSL